MTRTEGPEAPEYVRTLAVYVPGKPIEEVRRELGISDEIVKLASNENPLGASPAAVAAIQRVSSQINRYPDGSGYYLRQTIAQRYGIEFGQVILGNGSTEIIEMLARAYLADGDEAVFSQQSFVMYPIAVAQVNGKGIAVPARADRKHDVDAMLAAITPKTKLVYVANPSNPTGTYIGRAELTRLVEGTPEHTLLIVDQAYQEYVDAPDYPEALDDLKRGRENVVVLRTFSKIFGLAAARIGYAVAHPQVIETLNRVRSPFNTSQLAQEAALAALGDTAWVDRCRTENARERAFLEGEMKRRGVRYTPSVTNFVLIEVDGEAQSMITDLEKRGVIVRPVGGPGLKNCLRVSIGTRVENEKFLHAFDEVTAGDGRK
jgi:histidinol-phosphate aminotransferase